MCLLLALAIALVSLGPLIDHHFAERHPGHQHFYQGSADLSHPHSYENSHPHRYSWVYSTLGSAEEGLEANGIIFLMPSDGIGLAAADIAVPMTIQAVRFGGTEGNGPPGPHAEAEMALSGAPVAPPAPPPRA